MCLGGLAGLILGHGLSTVFPPRAAAASSSRSGSGAAVGIGAGLAPGLWGQAGVIDLALLGAVVGIIVGLEVDRILRQVRREWRQRTG